MVVNHNIVLLRPSFQMIYSQENPPIGLGYLASYLEQFEFKVSILDLSIRRITAESLMEFLSKKKPVMIGITALTAYYNSAKELAWLIKKELPSIPLVLGGVHASSLPEISLEESRSDFVVIGEGEETTLELARALVDKRGDFSKIKGLVFRTDGKIVVNEPRALIPDLDSLPMPAWHRIDPNKYPRSPHGSMMKFKEVAPILSSRGCPYACDFCASCNFWGQKIRFRSAVKIVDEMAYLKANFGIKEFHFWDDNLTVKRSHIEGICKEIIRRRLKIAIAMPNGVRVDSLDEKLLKLMKQAGFYFLIFAVESWSKDVLVANNKKTSLVKIAKNVIIAKKLGIELGSFFIFGLKGDTVESMRRTIRFTKSLPFDQVAFFLLKPLPGSKMFNSWSDGKDLKDFDWNAINYFNSKVAVNQAETDVLEAVQRQAYNEIYLRLPALLKTMFYRFVKRGHLFQLKFYIQKLTYALLGFEK